MISAYHPDEKGRLVPEIPTRGPCSGWDKQPCRLLSDHDRERKTGPCFPIRVMRCRVHRHGFTLYPPGHVPYGRKRWVAVAWDGSLEQSEEDSGAEASLCAKASQECLGGTYWEAALDAAAGKAWPQAGYEGSRQERFPTQMRQLRRSVRLLGVAPELSRRQRERIAAVLAVPGQKLEDAARGLETGAGYRSLGQAAVGVLRALHWEASVFERLAESGFAVGLWPQPRVCLGPGRPLRLSPFRGPGTRPPPHQL